MAVAVSNEAHGDGVEKMSEIYIGDNNNDGWFINDVSHVSGSPTFYKYGNESSTKVGNRLRDASYGPVIVNMCEAISWPNIGLSAGVNIKDGTAVGCYKVDTLGQDKDDTKMREINVSMGSKGKKSKDNVHKLFHGEEVEKTFITRIVNDEKKMKKKIGRRSVPKATKVARKAVIALDRKLLDHCPIVLKDVELDFGPKPIRVFNTWLEESDFLSIVEGAWMEDVRSIRSDYPKMAAESTVPQLVDKKGDDIMESVISCETTKAIWNDLVHSFKGPSDTMENRIMDLKLEYQTYRVKPSESLLQAYTRYKTLLNKLANDGVNLSKHEINISMEENSNDEVDERSSEEYLRDLDIEFCKRSLLANSKHFIKRRNNFSSQKANEDTDCYKCGKSQPEPKIQKDYKTEYKKIKAKLALLEASASTSHNPKTSQSKNKGLVAETFDLYDEELSDDEEITQVKVLMALANNELTMGKNYACNGEWIDITMRKVNILLSMDEDVDWQNYLKYINVDLKYVEEKRLNLLSKYNKIVFELNKCSDDLLVLKQTKLEVVTFQIQNTKLTKLNHALQEQLKEERKINEKWLTSSKKVSQCISEQIPDQKKKILEGEMLTESSSKKDVNENLLIPAFMGYDHEMVPKSKEWVKSHNPDSKLPNFNTGRILVPKIQVVNECLKPTEALNDPESSKYSEAKSLTPLPPLKNL
ncbi:hypothetical protein Tco_1124224 [Tanacetum coccineum]|uniref:Uncharacterized protein n=1 Tax=Tanacetum coccineum TaxID=301880 RepID=A0ABQ5J5M9_9ASTR